MGLFIGLINIFVIGLISIFFIIWGFSLLISFSLNWVLYWISLLIGFFRYLVLVLFLVMGVAVENLCTYARAARDRTPRTLNTPTYSARTKRSRSAITLFL